MLAAHFAMIRNRQGAMRRYATDPHQNAAMTNYVNTMLRAYDTPDYYDYATSSDIRLRNPEHVPYSPDPMAHTMFEHLFQTGDPGALYALLDHLGDRGIPHQLNPERTIGYQVPEGIERMQSGPGSIWGAILPHGVLRHIAAGLHDPTNLAAFHPEYFPHALGGQLPQMLDTPDQPPWHAWSDNPAQYFPLQSFAERMAGRARGLHVPYYAEALRQLQQRPTVPGLLRMYDTTREYQNNFGGQTFNTMMYPRDDVAHRLLTHVIPALRASVQPGTAHLPHVGGV